ncbi:MAG: hypothetical protein IJY86_11215 [Clostridia bacterium]|nr:hypothetical protein [Clostridia bacterium]
MKKKIAYISCIGIAVSLVICSILYFRPLPLSSFTDKNSKIHVTLIEDNIDNGGLYSDSTEYPDITEEQHGEILSVLEEYSCRRTFGTLFSKVVMQGLGNRVLYIANGQIITVAESGKLSINSKTYRINNADQLIGQILEIVE